MNPNTIKEFFLDELADVHDGEKSMVKELSKPAESATSTDPQEIITGKVAHYGMASYD